MIALLDTNCDPDEVQYPIPANDDAIRAVRLLASKIADAVIEGRQARESAMADLEVDVPPADAASPPTAMTRSLSQLRPAPAAPARELSRGHVAATPSWSTRRIDEDELAFAPPRAIEE